MKMLKNLRKISAVLALATAVSALPAWAWAEDAAEDIENEVIEEISEPKKISETASKEYKLLTTLAILGNDYESDNILTRGELAALLCRVTGYSEGEKAFEDVTDSTANAKAISIAAANGLMAGYADGTFRPYQKAEPMELIKAFLNLAGYSGIIKSENDYETYASSTGLLVAGLNDGLTWQGAVKIIYRGLYLELIEIKSFDEDGVSFEKKSTILLEKLFGLTEGRGTIVATEYAAIGERGKANEGNVTISAKNGDWTYITGNTDIEEYFGYNVRFYYYGNDDYTIAAYILDDDKNDVIEIDEERFDGINRELTRIDYTLPNETKTDYATLVSNPVMLYNGAEYYGVVKEDFDNADMIRLIDSNGDGKYDICSITDYETYFVDSISLKTCVVSDRRDGMSFTIDENENDITYIKSGIKTDISIIQSGDTLRIAKAKADSGNKNMTIVIASDLISGYVDAVDASGRYVTIDGEKYYVSKKLNISKMRGNISVGVDEFKKVICFDLEENPEKQYAWLMKVQQGEQEDGYEAHIKVMNMYGEFVTLPVAEKFYINNKSKKSYDLVSFAVSGVENPEEEGNWYAIEQLIAYTTDAKGAVKRLFFATDDAGVEKQSGAIDPENQNSLILNKKFSGRRIWDTEGTVNGEYIYGSNVYGFKIITDDDGRIIEELSGMFAKNQLKFTNGTRPTAYVYDAGSSCVAKVIVVKSSLSTLSSYQNASTQALVVESVEDGLDKDDEIVKEVHGYHGGAKVTYYVSEHVSFNANDWKSGDMFIISIGPDGKIMTATKYFSFEDTTASISPKKTYNADAPAVLNNGDYTESLNIVYGTIKEVINSDGIRAVRVRPEGSTSDLIYNFSGTCVYIYHTGSKPYIEVATIDDVSRGIGSGKAAMYTRYGNVRDIVIID